MRKKVSGNSSVGACELCLSRSKFVFHEIAAFVFLGLQYLKA